MNKMQRDSGSFRDPSGYIFSDGSSIIRAVTARADATFRQVFESGVIDKLTDAGLMIGCQDINATAEELSGYVGARSEPIASLYRHPKVPLITYPYEWTFSQLKDAALAHLKLQIRALKLGYDLSDATAYNMQFIDGKPVHIDVMSLRPYEDGIHWEGYNQFCRQFLLPLLLEAWAGLSFQTIYRGSMSGIRFEDALAILPKRKLFTSVSGFLHVYLHGKAVIAKSSNASGGSDDRQRLPKTRYLAILEQLSDFIQKLETAKRPASYWKTYATANSYTDDMRQVKLDFVKNWASQTQPKAIWDIGGNSGDFSRAAIEGGAESSVILDGDIDSLEFAYRKHVKSGEPLLPVIMDITDPTPAMGWQLQERKSLYDRAEADGIIALAVIHHMCISGNLPLDEAISWLVGLAPRGIIEFVPKRDPMVRQLLEVREDIFDDYEESVFRSAILKENEIVAEHFFEQNGRVLVSYRRRA